MKSCLLFAFLLFLCSSSFSQTYRNQWLVGGSGSFTHTSSAKGYSDSYKYTILNANADAGFFVINNLAVGARLGLDYSGGHIFNSDSDHYKYRNTTYNAGPFVRYYFLKATHRVNILADVAYKWYWNRDRYDSEFGKLRNKGYAFAAGAAWFISSHSALEVTAGYAHKNEFESNSDLSLNVGFHQHLGKAHIASARQSK